MDLIKQIRRPLATGALLALAALFVQVVLFAAPAEARCAGVNQPVTSTLAPNGITYVSETPVSGTCNDNGLYQATFKSYYAGWRAVVWIQNGGVWTAHWGGFDTATYSYNYTDPNSHSYISLCLDDGHGTTYCGWGTNYIYSSNGAYDLTYFGVNQGF